MMRIYDIPALLFYFPTIHPEIPTSGKGMVYDDDMIGCPDRNDNEMQKMFEIMNLILERELNRRDSKIKLINERLIQDRRDFMDAQYILRGGNESEWSPDTAIIEVSTEALINYLSKFVSQEYEFGSLLKSRETTIIYKARAKFRGDPYPGALAALDYLHSRIGKTYEDRDKNLVMAWGKIDYNSEENYLNIEGETTRGNDISVEQMVSKINRVADKFILDKDFSTLNDWEIPRFYMQTRHGTSFTLCKEIRMFSYFADAILFEDGAFWREG